MLKLPRPQKVLLKSGARLLYQRNPVSPTVAFGVWITRGSRNEKLSDRGGAHLLEHMVFRGTARRTALQIAFDLESVGGQWDAFTSKEVTCYHGKVLEEHFASFADILADIVLSPSIQADALRTEIRIIQEEIRSVADSPEESVYELFFRNLFDKDQLGYPVTGRISDLVGFTRKKLLGFHRRTYTGRNAVLGFVGNIPLKKVVAILDEKFVFRPGTGSIVPGPTTYTGKRKAYIKRPDMAQSHVCVGVRVSSASNRDRYPLMALSSILGGGVSSRMFQSLRENSGLAYSVFSHVNFWNDTGAFSTFFSVDPRNFPRALELFHSEMEEVRRGGVRKEELESAIAQLKGSVIFGIESVNSRLFRLFHNEFYYGKYRGLSTLIRNIERIGIDDIAEVVDKYFTEERHTYTAVGPLSLKGLIPEVKRRK